MTVSTESIYSQLVDKELVLSVIIDNSKLFATNVYSLPNPSGNLWERMLTPGVGLGDVPLGA
jgi:hypothetical protein